MDRPTAWNFMKYTHQDKAFSTCFSPPMSVVGLWRGETRVAGIDERRREGTRAEKGPRFTSTAEHLFQDDSQMLDRSSRYNPTSQANGMILNKGSHPLKHDRSSPRYVVVLRAAFARLRTTTNTTDWETNRTDSRGYDRAFHRALQLEGYVVSPSIFGPSIFLALMYASFYNTLPKAPSGAVIAWSSAG